MLLDFSKLDENQIYKLISNTVTPRPIAWISTWNEGITNLAPFSFFIPLSSNPPTLIVSIGRKEDDSPKDTLANLLANGKATICFVHDALKEQMAQSASELPHNRSEFEAFGIAHEAIIQNYPPIVKGAKAALFCTFTQTLDLKGSETTPCLLHIDHAFYADDVIDKQLHVSLENIGRVGKKYLVKGEIISF